MGLTLRQNCRDVNPLHEYVSQRTIIQLTL